MQRILTIALLVVVTVAALAAISPRADARVISANIINQPDQDRMIFRFSYKEPVNQVRVLIDWDNNPATGFQVDGIGADIMFRRKAIMTYTGSGQDEAWQRSGTLDYLKKSGFTKWKYFIRTPCSVLIKTIFQTVKPSGRVKSSGVIEHIPSCPLPSPTATNTRTRTPTISPTVTLTPSLTPSHTATNTPTRTPTRTRTPSDTPPPNTTPTWTPTLVMETRLLIPAYFYIAADAQIGCQETPPEDDCRYAPLIQQNTGFRRYVVLNPSDHPADNQRTGPLDGYARHIAALQAAKNIVLIYIPTNYAQRAAAEVKTEIDNFFEWYPLIDGFFFDEMSADCSDASYYHDLYAYRGTYPDKKIVVSNPGTNVPSCFANSADVLVTFEGFASDYAAWQPETWTNAYPAARFAHLIHTAPEDDLNALIALWESRNVGMIYITDDVMPNPWDTLPTYGEMLDDKVNTP